MRAPKNKAKQVVYVLPSEEVIEKFAADVWHKLDDHNQVKNPPGGPKQEFTDFMKLVVKIETEHRNPGGYYGE